MITAIKMNDNQVMVVIDGVPYHVKSDVHTIQSIYNLALTLEYEGEHPDLGITFDALKTMVDPTHTKPWLGNFNINNRGEVFYKDSKVAVSPTFKQRIEEHFKLHPAAVTALENFWVCALTNPDRRVIDSIFDFVVRNGLPITKQGYFIAYKRVKHQKNGEYPWEIEKLVTDLENDPEKNLTEWLIVERVETDMLDGGRESVIRYKAIHYSGVEPEDQIVGFVNNILKKIKSSRNVFVDVHTGKIRQTVGSVITQERKLCDSDPSIDCSNGLHVGNVEYVNGFAEGNPVMVVLVNPMNVVAVPKYDSRKMRTCEYFIMGFSEMDENKMIKPINSLYSPVDYLNYEKEQVEKLLQGVDPDDHEDRDNLEAMMRIIKLRME